MTITEIEKAQLVGALITSSTGEQAVTKAAVTLARKLCTAHDQLVEELAAERTARRRAEDDRNYWKARAERADSERADQDRQFQFDMNRLDQAFTQAGATRSLPFVERVQELVRKQGNP